MRRFSALLATLFVLVTALPALGSETETRVFEPSTVMGSEGATVDSVSLGADGALYVLGSKGSSAVLWKLDETQNQLLPGGPLANFPGGLAGGLAVDRAGRVYVAQANPVGSVVRRSSDGGSTWDRGNPLATPGQVRSLAAGRLNDQLDGSRLYAVNVFRANGVLSHSLDGGLTWTQHDPLFSRCGACSESTSDVVVSINNVAWLAHVDGTEIRARGDKDDGSSVITFWSPMANAVGTPSLAAGPGGDTYLAWATADGNIDLTILEKGGALAIGGRIFEGPKMVAPQVAVGMDSVGLTWFQQNEAGGWDLMFTMGEDLAKMEEPSLVETVTSLPAAPTLSMRLTTDASDVYRIVYERDTGAGTELRYAVARP